MDRNVRVKLSLGPKAGGLNVKAPLGNGKINKFLYVLQILQISRYTVETLQNYEPTSGLLEKNSINQDLAYNYTFLFNIG